MFLPKNLAEQLRRVVNFYFLIVTVIAVVIGEYVISLLQQWEAKVKLKTSLFLAWSQAEQARGLVNL